MRPTPATVDELDELISTPNQRVVETVRGLQGNIGVLGAGGKMGFHFSSMLQRSLELLGRKDRVTTISRFGDSATRQQFEAAGFHVVSADLAEPEQVAALPDLDHVISLVAIKFGTDGQPDLLRRINVQTSELLTERYRNSRIVMLSTGCVYAFTTPESGGSTEQSPLEPPGDYARSRLQQEQVFADAAVKHQTPTAIIRLNYAIDLRYGVLLDIAQRVFHELPVDVTMGYVNVIWQGDAVAHTIQALPHTSVPALPLNVTGNGILSVRELAERFGKRLGIAPLIAQRESETAWLNNAAKAHTLFGAPETTLDEMIEWTASWVEHQGKTLNKPTHFEARGSGY